MDECKEVTIQSINEPKNYPHDIDTMLMSDENLGNLFYSLSNFWPFGHFFKYFFKT